MICDVGQKLQFQQQIASATFLSMMSYLYEAGYLGFAMIKNKCWVKINVEQEMRMTVDNLIPKFKKV